MRVVYGGSAAGSNRVEGRNSREAIEPSQATEISDAKSVRAVTRINGQRIHFRDLACMAFPTKTDANLAFFARVDARTARRWLADDTEPPADVLGLVLAEIMKRFHQR
jgi:hypothetical protein